MGENEAEGDRLLLPGFAYLSSVGGGGEQRMFCTPNYVGVRKGMHELDTHEHTVGEGGAASR